MPELIFLLPDAGRHGNEAALLRPFVKESTNRVMTRCKHQNFIVYDEQSLAKRRDKIRGLNALDQIEFLHIVSRDQLKLTDRERKHHPGTTFGNAISHVDLPVHTPSNAWFLSNGEKKKRHGAGGRQEVGGRTPGISDADLKAWKNKSAEDMEPVCFHCMPKKLLQELTYSFEVKAWINLTGCESTLEEICIAEKLPCLTVCFTDAHVELMKTRLQARIFEMLQDPAEQNMCQPELVSLLGGQPTKRKAEGTGAPSERPNKAKKGSAAGKAAPKKKAAKGKGGKAASMLKRLKALQDGEDEADEEDEDEEEPEEEDDEDPEPSDGE